MRRLLARLLEGISLVFVAATLTVLVLVGVGAYVLIQHVASSKPPAPPRVSIIPPPVGGHPRGDRRWFLVVGDSVSAGVYPGSLGSATNPSYVARVASRLASRGMPWEPDDLACPGETTQTYISGCAASFTNPLLSGKPQGQVALDDIRGHRATLSFIMVELGANDLRSFRGSPTWMADAGALLSRLRTIVQGLEQAAPGVPVLLANYYNPFAAGDPSTVTQAAYVNGGLAELAQVEGATVVDFASAMDTVTDPGEKALCAVVDCAAQGLHPTTEGDARLATATIAALETAGIVPTPSPSPGSSRSPVGPPASPSPGATAGSAPAAAPATAG